MKFTKMHGCGNDYVYINCFEQKVDDPAKLSQKVSNRHFGVGSDGLVLIMASETCDCRMRMFNPDGSESEMCGNAIRCVGKFVYDRKIITKNPITVETLAGVKILDIKTDENGNAALIKVDMGEPILESEKIPVVMDVPTDKELALTVDEKIFRLTCVSMGNPHAVAVIADVDDFDVEKYGKVLEVDEHFPRKANIEFVEVVDANNLKMRVWERGTGETQACGTGTCATVVAACLNGICKKGEDVNVQLLGGNLSINWAENNHVYMTGPAEFVFDGELF